MPRDAPSRRLPPRTLARTSRSSAPRVNAAKLQGCVGPAARGLASRSRAVPSGAGQPEEGGNLLLNARALSLFLRETHVRGFPEAWCALPSFGPSAPMPGYRRMQFYLSQNGCFFDDNPLNLRLVQMLLESAGHEVRTATRARPNGPLHPALIVEYRHPDPCPHPARG